MRAGYLFFAFIGTFLVYSSVIARIDQCKALCASWSSVVTDKFQFRVLGSENVSEKLRARAVEAFQFLQMDEPEKIQVKRMSSLLRSCIGDETCIATHNALFVDEEWLSSLREEEQKFVLAHEGMHIKNKDTAQTIGAYLAIFVIWCAGIAYFKNKDYGVIGIGALGVIQLATLAAYHRYKEARADAGAAQVAPTDFQIIDDTNTRVDQAWPQKTWAWFCSWFDAYHADRFKNISN